jgi:uncharacterized protein (DUF1810 family)
MTAVNPPDAPSLGQQDPHRLDRFVTAQRGTFPAALEEVRAGRKQTHWMWFVFPQIQGLGSSENARFYAISGRDEAAAYLAHPELGPRLLEITRALLENSRRTAHEIFGSPDDVKLKSSMTLFAAVAPPGSVFEQVLEKFFGGERDPETVRRLG